ncbi:Inositol 2-dehydrogenase/D-chiro-inositol 3-dehydrogenase [Planctomycetes bacterium Poly30]|uniref:Inositol 2-dehydrogenase/D-chiro-inositol 3-dehydrogenase n=1 Tax=Saltatorellus ferox TaxID=2528018 RepID=A0A518ELI8_9BACT|nr:Inositol 2-dehydrogenase/D-chiro-inositol 3-dehydrogenase [Planctomycetes bacterium Poly30]
MHEPRPNRLITRRDVLKDTGKVSATAAMVAGGFANVHPFKREDTIHVALIGCGGRGSGAAKNALSVKRGPVKLVAMAEVFPDRLKTSYDALVKEFPEQADVPKERQFLGFDGYKHAIDCLRPGDIAIFATPPAFRWVHFKYAIEKGVHVFMEKPVCVDGPTARKMFALSEESKKKGLKVGVGLMSRHSRAMTELHDRIRGGEVGEIISQNGYRMQGAIATFRSEPKPEGISHLEYQLRRFHGFLWASGGGFNDFFIHIIDQLVWMKGALPVKAQAHGGRHYRTNGDGVPYVDQNLDTYGVEYTYPDGTKMMFSGRNQPGCESRFYSHLHGTKGSAIASANSDCGLPSSIHEGHTLSRGSRIWTSRVAEDETNPYQNEWEDLIDAIRDDKPFHEAQYGIEASLVCNLGRMAAHTGVEVTYEQMLACEHEFAPGVADLTVDSDSPLMPGENGLYAVPAPGIKTDREY